MPHMSDHRQAREAVSPGTAAHHRASTHVIGRLRGKSMAPWRLRQGSGAALHPMGVRLTTDCTVSSSHSTSPDRLTTKRDGTVAVASGVQL